MDKIKWMEWAAKLQSIAQAGIAYSENKFDIERFNEIRNISVDIVREHTGLETDKVRDIFASGDGYQTPKVDVRAVIFRDEKILLVQETETMLWCLPGGWADTGLTLKENTVKEALEEAGVSVECRRILAVMDRNRHNIPETPISIYKIFIECDYISGSFKENTETASSGYFGLNDLPPLMMRKTTKEQLEYCFKTKAMKYFTPYFD